MPRKKTRSRTKTAKPRSKHVQKPFNPYREEDFIDHCQKKAVIEERANGPQYDRLPAADFQAFRKSMSEPDGEGSLLHGPDEFTGVIKSERSSDETLESTYERLHGCSLVELTPRQLEGDPELLLAILFELQHAVKMRNLPVPYESLTDDEFRQLGGLIAEVAAHRGIDGSGRIWDAVLAYSNGEDDAHKLWERAKVAFNRLVDVADSELHGIEDEEQGKQSTHEQGVTLLDVAMFFEEGDKEAAQTTCGEWHNRKLFRDLTKLGKDPNDGRGNLTGLREIVKKVRSALSLNKKETADLRNYLETKQRLPAN